MEMKSTEEQFNNFHQAWINLFMRVCIALRIDKVCEWLNKKLK